MQSFHQMTRTRFHESAERLVKLIELDAPSYILAGEVALLFSRGTILFPELWANVGKTFADSQHAINGACKVCAEIKESVSCGLCKDCEFDGDDFDPEHN